MVGPNGQDDYGRTPDWEKGANVPGVGRVQRRVVRVADEVDITCMTLPMEGCLVITLEIEGQAPGVKVKSYGFAQGSSLAQRTRSGTMHVVATQLGVLTDLYFDANALPDHRPDKTQGTIVARIQRSDDMDDALGRVARALRACGAISVLTAPEDRAQPKVEKKNFGATAPVTVVSLDDDGQPELTLMSMTPEQAKNFARDL